jgi:hypothetical protein
MDDGWGFRLVRTTSVKKEKKIFAHNGGVRRAKVAAPSHHKDRSTVHGRVEFERDTKGVNLDFQRRVMNY